MRELRKAKTVAAREGSGERVFRRVVDEKGRVTLPTEMRQQLEIRAGEEVEFLLREDGEWYIRKGLHQRSCTFCGCGADLIEVWGQVLCRRCAQKYVFLLARELRLDISVGTGGNLPD
ncbi:MAG: AbrB/MazE/SpoVT family DNA-binding domain-containing protein [Thermanaeromonas sp.]|uniref:AbrB/MazE/SpoVT family DNA-binding domain-containing protein n=1 Tax=Thermanaeromonas sp. TaxID=2003697 RepID=UPI00243794F2|nr:AbrB/MazE/SpoVT family DNA-binding domain-containing protein [Thermanaeromonas sp.]MCG0277083.1 AbrB/MazE/SpoVT family DNA-binding domain-containing protein [Thermanaeromonas sp.]